MDEYLNLSLDKLYTVLHTSGLNKSLSLATSILKLPLEGLTNIQINSCVIFVPREKRELLIGCVSCLVESSYGLVEIGYLFARLGKAG